MSSNNSVSEMLQDKTRVAFGGGISREWLRALVLLSIGLVLLAISYSDTLFETVAVWRQSAHFRMGWFVVPAVVFLLWYNRQDFVRLTPVPSWWGVPFALFFSLLWITGEWVNIAIIRQLALWGGMCALVLTVVGMPVFRILIPYLVMLLFALPFWVVFLPVLKSVAIILVKGYATVVQLPLEVNGYSLYVGSKSYIVIDYCAGLQFILLGLFTGCAFGILIYRSLLKIYLVAFLGGCLALLANAIRISGIITYDYLFDEVRQLDHAWFELPALIPCFAVLFYIFHKLNPEDSQQESESVTQGNLGSRTKAAFFWPVLVMAVVVAGPLLASTQYISSETEAPSVLLANEIGGWKKDPAKPFWQPGVRSEQVADEAANFYLDGKQILLYQAVPLSAQAKISGDAIRLFNKGNPYNHVEKLDLCDTSQCLGSYVHATYIRANTRQVGHLYYAYRVGNHFTASVLEFRLLRGYSRIWAETQPQVSLIAIISDSGAVVSSDELMQLFSGVVQL